MSTGEPALPASFTYGEDALPVGEVTRRWKTSKTDRGDDYVDRYWFEFVTSAARTAVVYFDRHAKGRQPRWWLYTLEAED
ncbi:MAG: hypothetical protein NVS2B17_08500 [Candidatus Velthaea sp.]